MYTSLEPSPTPGSTELRIAHFNDVYQVSDQKIQVDGKQETINVTKFATLLNGVTSQWKERDDGKKEGLILFSGDLVSPSVESSITRGRHMTSVIDALKVDVGVVGNHEFDLGYPRLSELVKDTAFPWLLSNIIDTNTNKVPEPLVESHVLERLGVRIGFIGLVEEDWIATITGWPSNFKYQEMAKVGKDLSALLRDPTGPYKCDFIIALTHSRTPNDISLARDLFALSPEAQANTDITSQHGVDLLLGGHDHVYWVSKGIPSWDGYDVQQEMLDAASDRGDVLVVKSGTDFRDLSEVVLTLKDTAAGSIRRKVIESIQGVRHVTRESTEVDEDMKSVVDLELADITAAMKEPVFSTATELDVQSSYIRLGESPIGNWVADGLRNAYDEALVKLGYEGTDGVIICMGDLRGDGVYPPGPLTLGNLMTVLPFLDPMVVLELDGNALWDAMESGLSRWPVHEGRFPAVSGFRVSWDSSRAGGSRVLGIWLQEESKEVGDDGKPKVVDKEEVLRTSDRKYVIMVGQYMAEGGDGYDVLKSQKVILGEENGQSKSALIRKFLLGAHYLTQVAQTEPKSDDFLHPETVNIVAAAKGRFRLPNFAMPSIPDVQLPKSPGLSLPSPQIKLPSMPDLTQNLPFSSSKIKLPSMSNLHFPSSKSSPVPTPQVKLPSIGQFVPQVPQNPQRHISNTQQGIVGDVMQLVADGATEVIDDLVQIAAPTLKWFASRELYSNALKIAEREDMGFLDVYEKRRARRRAARSTVKAAAAARTEITSSKTVIATAQNVDADEAKVEEGEEEVKDLPIIHPIVDGRLKDAAAGSASRVQVSS
ncbi:Metallo-dependent phosphatase [Paxillus ammoniavirescens]|nr:Metallo-dependent phosphatase [Paxillus ammoniavirescens]